MAPKHGRTSEAAKRGDTPEWPECQRCLKGPSCHSGHDRRDPECVLHGCSSKDPKEREPICASSRSTLRSTRLSPAGKSPRAQRRRLQAQELRQHRGKHPPLKQLEAEHVRDALLANEVIKGMIHWQITVCCSDLKPPHPPKHVSSC